MMKPVEKAYIGLGSNQGDRLHNLCAALSAPVCQTAVVKVSSIYETVPVGGVSQDPFLNMVAVMETRLGPYELLSQLQTIEAELGRQRTIRWGPRTIDLDILCIPGQRISSPVLEVPHPRLLERAFVLVPLAEVAPQLLVAGKPVVAHLHALEKRRTPGDVVLWGDPPELPTKR